MTKIKTQLGDLELAVMNVVWGASEPMEVSEVVTALDHTRAYTTIMTTMARLHEKGFLDQERVGRAYRYRPRMTRTHVVQRMWRRISDILTDGDVLELVPHLLGKSGEMSEEERRVLQRMADNIQDRESRKS